jgi:hypothetical protein
MSPIGSELFLFLGGLGMPANVDYRVRFSGSVEGGYMTATVRFPYGLLSW